MSFCSSSLSSSSSRQALATKRKLTRNRNMDTKSKPPKAVHTTKDVSAIPTPSLLTKKDNSNKILQSQRQCHHPSEYDHNYHGDNIETTTMKSKDYDNSNVFRYEYDGDNDEYLSPTESVASSFSSLQIERPSSDNIFNNNRRDLPRHNHSDPNNRTATATTSKISGGGLPTSSDVAKITALVEQELKSQRRKHKEQLDRKVKYFKARDEKFQKENNRLRLERDKARKGLEKMIEGQAEQRRVEEGNDRLQDQKRSRIESLENEKGVHSELQDERDSLLDEVGRLRQQHQKAEEELILLKVRVREDSEKRLSVMECLSTSWEYEQKEARQKEKLLNSELDIMSKTLKVEQYRFKDKTEEFVKLEALYRSTKAELESTKEIMIPKEEEMTKELLKDRESHQSMCEEQKRVLKLKNDEILKYEATIRSMQSELESTIERSNLKEESIVALQKDMQNREQDKNSILDPEVNDIRQENNHLQSEVNELKRQVESYLQNMALQQEFCDSLKGCIYKEQETEQEQMEQIYKLRKQIRKQQREVEEKDSVINELKNMIGDNGSVKTLNSNGSRKSSLLRNHTTAPKKSNLKQPRHPKASKAMHK